MSLGQDYNLFDEGPLSEEDQLNLFNFWAAVALSFEEMRARPLAPFLLDEYCWMHGDIPGGGGWDCGVCIAEIVKQQKIRKYWILPPGEQREILKAGKHGTP